MVQLWTVLVNACHKQGDSKRSALLSLTLVLSRPPFNNSHSIYHLFFFALSVFPESQSQVTNCLDTGLNAHGFIIIEAVILHSSEYSTRGQHKKEKRRKMISQAMGNTAKGQKTTQLQSS